MSMLICCNGCHTPIQLPPGTTAFRCIVCRSIGNTASPSSAPILYPPVPPTTSSNYHGQKKAVIIGILYKNQKGELRGCINDAKTMKDMLIHRFNFNESSIFMLTDEETDPRKIPTKHNILIAMSWLVNGCKSRDSLVFYFSGHGGRQPNNTGDEKDNYDETLLPLDHGTQGPIVDNDINDIVVKPLPTGVKLHAIIDACHSGTVLDLPYLCKMDRSGRYSSWEDHSPKSGTGKGTSGGEVISISGCADHQYSDDTNALSKEKMPAGAMTYAFIQAIQNGQGATYGSILHAMRTHNLLLVTILMSTRNHFHSE
ncbi:metacaspase-1-like isoform X2 [Salvia hispanica]|uniref:metacaspase-1-like isoform X2 n=1 Tax=Salvia hispanica TaxID=49212 RepID=UPI002008F72C|nr:metacaspase-1-like isoform X2 [Salvia hispanica]